MKDRVPNMDETMKNLPDDIIFYDILVLLQPKSVFRCMCVCKSWNSFMKSSNFISKHYPHHPLPQVNYTKDKNSYILYMPHTRQDKYKSISTLVRDQINKPPTYTPLPDRVDVSYKLSGVCEGLVCLQESFLPYEYFCVWDPLEKNIDSFYLREPGERSVLGLGFSTNIHDYKVVRIFKRGYGALHEVKMYSLSTNSWRQLDHCNVPQKWPWSENCSSSVFFQGSIYWLSYVAGTSVVRFDLDMEKFVEMALPPLPESSDDRDYSPINRKQLVVANGVLLLLQLMWASDGIYVQAWEKNKESDHWIICGTTELILPMKEVTNFRAVRFSDYGHLVFPSGPLPGDAGKVFVFAYKGTSEGCKWKQIFKTYKTAEANRHRKRNVIKDYTWKDIKTTSWEALFSSKYIVRVEKKPSLTYTPPEEEFQDEDY